jgi:ketosteroid isomerase-like protein
MHKFLIIMTGCVLVLTGCSGTLKENRVGNSTEMEEAIAALRGAYAAFNRGDIDAAVAVMDSQIEWSEPAEFPGGGTYHGREGAKQYLTQSRNGLAEGTSEPEQFFVSGDRVVVFVYAHVRPKESNEWRDVRLADVFTFRGGKATAMRAFADRQEALRWVGLPSESR